MFSIIKEIFTKKKNSADSMSADKVDYKKQGNSFLAQGELNKARDSYYSHINFNPNDPEGYLNLGFVLIEIGDHEAAKTNLLKSISLNDGLADAFYLLGLLHQEKQLILEAIDYYKSALSKDPTMNVVYQQLHAIYTNHPDFDQIKEILVSNALQHQEVADAQFFAGDICLMSGEIDASIHYFNKALVIDTDNEVILFKIGAAHQKAGKSLLAEEAFRKAIDLNKDYSEAYNDLVCVLLEQNKLDDGIAVCEQAILANPDRAETYNNLGAILYKKNEFHRAISNFEKALSINPDYFDAHNNAAEAFARIDCYGKTIIHYKKAMTLREGTAIMVNAMADAFRMQGDMNEALAEFRHALSIPCDSKTMNKVNHSLLFFLSCYPSCSPEEYLKEAVRYGARVSRAVIPYENWLTPLTKRYQQPLRVGLVSGDLWQHPVGYFVENVIKRVNPQCIQWLVYNTGSKEDELTQRLTSYSALWAGIADLDDEAAAKRIRDDRVDILIDLSGFTRNNRLEVFAWKPAPIQVTWLGYWASTGISAIDYVLTDEVSLPVSSQNQFAEKVWYLPNTRMCFSAPSDVVSVDALPALTNGHITFGSFQNISKITDEVLALWAKVLSVVPTARLRLQNKQLIYEDAQILLKTRLTKAGILPERVIMLGGMPRQAYLNAHREVDIVLDTFPFSGGTTTCEALWMGVPTITLAGNTMINRQGASMLACAGLRDWVAQTEEEYIAIAINKAEDVNVLAQLRANLREQVKASPLFEATLFAQYFEDAICGMWNKKIETINCRE